MSTAGMVIIWLTALLNGAVIGFGIGFGVCLAWGKAHKQADEPAAPAPEVADEEKLEAIRKEREELIASQKAFQTMMGYNADIAYGISGDDDFPAGGI